MAQYLELSSTVSDSQLGQRLDQALAELFPDYSGSRIKEWILADKVSVDGAIVNKPRVKMMGGEAIVVEAEIEDEQRWAAQDIPLDIVYEDDDILVINKPRGLVVHPGAGCPDGTILNGLLFRYPDIAEVPRAGIVHRLDKDTTGLMVVAKTIPAQTRLVRALQKRKKFTREYEAIVIGTMTGGGTIEKPIGRRIRRSAPRWQFKSWVNLRSRITVLRSISVRIRVCVCVWKQAVHTKFVFTCLT
ncbi:pseudouridine synthase [Enterovibrio sp. Hal110]